MSKAFTKEVVKKNYITPSGLQRLLDERRFLLTRERPAVTQVVAVGGEQRRSQRKRRLSVEVRYERIPVDPFTEPPGAEAAPK